MSSNAIGYSAEVTDPFFSATTKSVVEGNTLWQADLYANALACADQHQFCANGQCTSLTAITAALDATNKLNLNHMQSATKDRFANLSSTHLIYYSVQGLGANALRASDLVADEISAPLPSNQWTGEVSAWMATSMARLQQLTAQYAAGPPSGNASLVAPPESKEEKSMCRSQIVRSSSGTTSFSVLGLAIILCVGAILIALSLTLSTGVGFVRRLTGYGDYKRMQWILDEQLQLHRLAYEGAGQGDWADCASSVPITRRGDKLGLPKGMDKKHPRLSKKEGL
ncbi:MAG: hypothetical protein Q9218_003121, partial [Villophora microphyllina]